MGTGLLTNILRFKWEYVDQTSFIDDVPIQTSMFKGFSIATFGYQSNLSIRRLGECSPPRICFFGMYLRWLTTGLRLVPRSSDWSNDRKWSVLVCKSLLCGSGNFKSYPYFDQYEEVPEGAPTLGYWIHAGDRQAPSSKAPWQLHPTLKVNREYCQVYDLPSKWLVGQDLS